LQLDIVATFDTRVKGRLLHQTLGEVIVLNTAAFMKSVTWNVTEVTETVAEIPVRLTRVPIAL
jgi:hypothetical protein